MMKMKQPPGNNQVKITLLTMVPKKEFHGQSK